MQETSEMERTASAEKFQCIVCQLSGVSLSELHQHQTYAHTPEELSLSTISLQFSLFEGIPFDQLWLSNPQKQPELYMYSASLLSYGKNNNSVNINDCDPIDYALQKPQIEEVLIKQEYAIELPIFKNTIEITKTVDPSILDLTKKLPDYQKLPEQCTDIQLEVSDISNDEFVNSDENLCNDLEIKIEIQESVELPVLDLTKKFSNCQELSEQCTNIESAVADLDNFVNCAENLCKDLKKAQTERTKRAAKKRSNPKQRKVPNRKKILSETTVREVTPKEKIQNFKKPKTLKKTSTKRTNYLPEIPVKEKSLKNRIEHPEELKALKQTSKQRTTNSPEIPVKEVSLAEGIERSEKTKALKTTPQKRTIYLPELPAPKKSIKENIQHFEEPNSLKTPKRRTKYSLESPVKKSFEESLANFKKPKTPKKIFKKRTNYLSEITVKQETQNPSKDRSVNSAQSGLSFCIETSSIDLRNPEEQIDSKCGAQSITFPLHPTNFDERSILIVDPLTGNLVWSSFMSPPTENCPPIFHDSEFLPEIDFQDVEAFNNTTITRCKPLIVSNGEMNATTTESATNDFQPC